MNRYAEISDTQLRGFTHPVELIAKYHRGDPNDLAVGSCCNTTPVDELYQELSTAGLERLIQYGETLICDGDGFRFRNLCASLAAFTEADLEPLLRSMIEADLYEPDFAFNKASKDLASRLLDQLKTDEDNRLEILFALAWTGDVEAIEWCTRQGWQLPAKWTIPACTKVAGWELDSKGARRDLYYTQCYALRYGKSPDPQQFRAITPRTDNCPWCSRPLINLLELGATTLAKLGITGFEQGLQIATCDVCTAFASSLFGELNQSGYSEWSLHNVRPDYLPDDADSWEGLPTDCLHLAAERPPLFAANQFLSTTFSQLGGHPTWIQCAAYPTCPECKQTMMCLAQIDHSEIEEYAEGTYYAYLCPECRVTATNYQQT
ncbi:hypothetical protein [Aeoliella mucimassa]|uniref:hypothetical protein n=1 Tax=Aeoliella mucimassa TaxID=2527972 RepID=UPI0018D353F2|nr:hypothetical protein [Aeoliella mucimassa]